MIIKNIAIQNFRCFKSYEISFGKETTVLIGKNGTGKTNLLTGLVYSLSFPFAKNIIKGIQTIGTSSPDLKIAAIDNKGTFDARFDNKINDYVYPIKLTGKSTFDSEDLEWSMVKEKKGGGLSSSLYKKAFQKFQQYYNENNSNKPLPVLAFFADSFPHIEANLSGYAKSILASQSELPRNFGYYKWDEKNNCIGIWKERYANVYNSLNNFKRPEYSIITELNELYLLIENAPDHEDILKWELKAESLRKDLDAIRSDLKKDPKFIELNFIDSKLKKFTESLNDKYDFINTEFQIKQIKVVGASRSEEYIQFDFIDGRTMFFDNLPMGYKRLFSIVFDIAYRSFILNKATDPTGIVVIDELELHLHPTLQQEVLSRLKMTFPRIQFIVCTHSPLVISNLKANGEDNKVIRLENNGDEYSWVPIDNIYGIDYTTGLINIMDAPYRPVAIDNLIDSYVILKLRNRDSDALKVWNEIFELVGIGNKSVEKEIKEKLESNK
jgi:predicted ATP-binding protein involved in virulence